MAPAFKHQHLRTLRFQIARTALPKFAHEAGDFVQHLQVIFPTNVKGERRWLGIEANERTALMSRVHGCELVLSREGTTKDQATQLLPNLLGHLGCVLAGEPGFKDRIDVLKRLTGVDHVLAISAESDSRRVALNALHRTLCKVPASLDVVSQALVTTCLDLLDPDDKLKNAENLQNASFTEYDISNLTRRIDFILINHRLPSVSLTEVEGGPAPAASISHRTAKLHGTTPSRWAAARARRF